MSWIAKIVIFSFLHTVLSKKAEKVENTEEISFENSIYGENLNLVTKSVCDAFTEMEHFHHLIAKTCPPNYDPVCDDPIFGPSENFEFRCQLSINNDEVLLLNSSSFLEIAKLRDSKKRNWCMITLFYAHNCQFSAQLAPSFNKLPSLYNNLLAVAIQGTEFTKLNFRYGISGTPTVLLWINGVAVSRMSTKNLNLTGLTNFIGSHTDLVPNQKPFLWNIPKFVIDENGEKLEREPEIEVLEGSGAGVQVIMSGDRILPFLYTFLSFAVCITTFIYHIRERLLLSPPILNWMMSRFGAALCEDIYFLLYVEPPRARDVPRRPEGENGEDDEEDQEEEFEINNDLPPLVID